MNNDEALEMLEGGPSRPDGHVADVLEGQGPFAFGSPWSGIAKLSEELGELQTVIGKLLGTGGDRQHWQGDLVPRLAEEMADVEAALIHVYLHTPVNSSTIRIRRDLKLTLFDRWHAEGKHNRDART